MAPSILYLHSHDTGRWIQPYGWPVATPALARFADQGWLFRDAHCAGPTCSPSRAGLLTGAHPHSVGMIGLAHRGFRLRDVGQHLVHTLHAAGYSSWLAGIQHVMPRATDIGYTGVLTDRHEQADARACAFLAASPAEPFFLDVGFFETHRPFPAPGPEDRPERQPASGALPDAPETRADLAAFAASARILDRRIGAVLAALDAAGLAERTLVIVTTDHGPAFPLMKCTLGARGTGVMLMLRGPGGFTGGRVSDALVSQLDLFPTICGLAGIAVPPWVRGRSLLPLAAGEAAAVNEAVFAEVTYHAAYEPQRAVRTKAWSYIRRFGDRPQPVLPNCDESPSKSLLLRHGWATSELPRESLHDLMADPGENRNRSGDPGCAAILAEMRGRLDAWMRDTADPLLAGPVPAPAGAHMTPVAAATPEDGVFTVPAGMPGAAIGH